MPFAAGCWMCGQWPVLGQTSIWALGNARRWAAAYSGRTYGSFWPQITNAGLACGASACASSALPGSSVARYSANVARRLGRVVFVDQLIQPGRVETAAVAAAHPELEQRSTGGALDQFAEPWDAPEAAQQMPAIAGQHAGREQRCAGELRAGASPPRAGRSGRRSRAAPDEHARSQARESPGRARSGSPRSSRENRPVCRRVRSRAGRSRRSARVRSAPARAAGSRGPNPGRRAGRRSLRSCRVRPTQR